MNPAGESSPDAIRARLEKIFADMRAQADAMAQWALSWEASTAEASSCSTFGGMIRRWADQLEVTFTDTREEGLTKDYLQEQLDEARRERDEARALVAESDALRQENQRLLRASERCTCGAHGDLRVSDTKGSER